MSIGHIVGTLSEPLSKGFCLLITANEPICSLLAVGVHELLVEPLVDSTIYAGISTVSLDYEKTLEHLYNIDPYNFATKVVGSLLASKAGEHAFGEQILVSTISGVTGSYLADAVYNSIYASNHTSPDSSI